MATERTLDRGEGITRFLGVAADARLLGEDGFNLPDAEQHRELASLKHEHDRLVIAGSTLTGVSLVAGLLLVLYGGSQVLLNGGGVFDLVLAVMGILLVATHWGWVHVAEYVGMTIDQRHERTVEERRRDWLSSIAPYPRFSVSTSVLEDASTRVERFLHQPVLTEQQTSLSSESLSRRSSMTLTCRRRCLPRPWRRHAVKRVLTPTGFATCGRPPLRPMQRNYPTETTSNGDWPRSAPRPPRCPNT
jgi:hypothetical protein